MADTERGKLVVIYGANNLGKTTQADLLGAAIEFGGVPVERLKYPIYDLLPTGPTLNNILRDKKVPMPPVLKFQQMYADNRRDFQPTLTSYLDAGIWVVAEDYIGTGKAWGVTGGASIEELEAMNQGLIDEDYAFVLFGDRFMSGVEEGHKHESKADLWKKAQDNHLLLAEIYRWRKIHANLPKQTVHSDLMQDFTEFIFSDNEIPGYLFAALSGGRDNEWAVQAIKDAVHTNFGRVLDPHVADSVQNSRYLKAWGGRKLRNYDTRQMFRSKFGIGDITHPSTGVGIELKTMISEISIPVLALRSSDGKYRSAAVEYEENPNFSLQVYQTEDDIKEHTYQFMRKVKNG